MAGYSAVTPSTNDYTLSDGFSYFMSNMFLNKRSSLLQHFFRTAKLSAIDGCQTPCFSFMCLLIEHLALVAKEAENPHT